MNNIWQVSIDDYLEVISLAKKLGIKEGESIESVFLAYMEIKGKHPIGKTELNREEMIKEYLSHGKSILNMETNNGKTNFNIIKESDNL